MYTLSCPNPELSLYLFSSFCAGKVQFSTRLESNSDLQSRKLKDRPLSRHHQGPNKGIASAIVHFYSV